uniref:Histone-lysine N-methyltransferase trr n=1 Tax=Ascaris suum TaxID=6253 RepID=F1KPX5_ASCSU
MDEARGSVAVSSASTGIISPSAQRAHRFDAFTTRRVSYPPNSISCDSSRKRKMQCGQCPGEVCAAECPRRQAQPSASHCAVCTRPVATGSSVRSCGACRKWIHEECDADALGGGTVEGEYICAVCRNSPLVADAMMTSAGSSSLAASPTSISAHDDTSRNTLETGFSLQSPTNRNSPLAPLSNLDSTFNDIFTISHRPAGHGDVSSMSSPATTTATTTASNSARGSPAFFLENTPSSDTDDFRPPPRREKTESGSHSGRGGRGGGKKKPGTGRGSLTKLRASHGDLTEGTSSLRGKRGGRGGYKNGKGTRGRRPRGGKTSSMIAVVASSAAAREAEQHALESVDTEDGKNRVEDNDYIRTVVITRADNAFFMQMPVCLICGSIGNDIEGTMVSCATCAQSYHTFCVGLHDKLNSTVVKRGWRCLDCTVCEGCGDGRDESNLLLCDECDISYHIYCLDPPLECIPHGSWRCKWCATCRRCSAQIPNGTDTQRMEGLCETCYSLRKCPKCLRLYEIGEHIIKCQHCSRWLHGKCEEICGEEMLEAAAENGFRCSLCRPQGNAPTSDALNVLVCDNVPMNRCALDVLHTKHGGSLFRSASVQEPLFDLPLHPFAARGHSFDDIYEEEEMEVMGGGMSGRGRGMRGGGPGRKVLKLGVGGFFVKMPRHRIQTAEEDANADEELAPGQKPKIKRPRKPRRCQLEDNYPPIIQESFFGMRPVEGRNLLEVVVDEPSLPQEFSRTTLGQERQKEVFELNEADSEALREGESLLGDITENDIFGNMEEIDFDNFDINELLMEGEDDDDEDTLDAATNEGGTTCEDAASGQSQQHGSLLDFHGAQQARNTNGRGGDGQASQHPAGPHSSSAYPLQTNLQSSGSRSNSQMGENYVERVNQATERWEEDEPLGERATKAAVLYANVNYPQWKKEYPEWCERVKHIHRMWRSLDANSRQEYVNRARENRANRAKQPRLKRLAPALLRASIGSPKCGSPGRSGYYSSQDGEGAGGTGAGLTRPPPARSPRTVLAQLSSEVLDNYNLLQRRSNELAKYQQVIENDLARMRKQKKNLTAKRRQLNKNNQQFDASGRRIDVELNESDRSSLASLINAIPIRQKDLENCKRDIKQHLSNVRDFEVKNNIPPDLLAHIPPPVPPSQPGMPNVNPIRAPHPHVPGQPAPGDVMSPGAVRAPPPYTQMGGANNVYPGRPPMQQYIPPNGSIGHASFIQPKVESEQSQICSGPPTPSSGRPGSSASGDWQARTKVVRKRRRDEDGMDEFVRTPVLGDVVASQLTSQLERDVYDVVDHLLTQAVIMVDGAEAARKSGMLKRLLESHPGKPYQSQRTPYSGFDIHDGESMRHGDGPKPKKKRTQQKKLPVGTSNEFELLVERISTQLRLCPPLPRRALEPIPRIDRSSFAACGLTDLPDRTDKPSIVGSRVGDMRLVFMRDYYTRMFECPVDEETLYPSMSTFIGEVSMAALYQARCGSPVYSWREEYELERSCAKLEALSVERRSRSPPLRTLSRIPDTVAPQPPHRSSFFKKKELKGELMVNLIVEGGEGEFNPALTFDRLMTLLNVSTKPEYQLDTPPQTPEIAHPESLEGIKTEEFTREELQSCRHCGVLMEEPVIRQPAKQLAIIPQNEKDEEVLFCSMACYYNFVANTKVALSPDDLTRAERFVDEATMAKLRQISADNFAKCLHLGKLKSESISTPHMGSGDVCSTVLDPRFAVLDSDSRNQLQVIHVRELSMLNDSSSQRNFEKKWKGHMWMQCDAALIESFRRLTSQVRQKHMAAQLQSLERTRGLTRADDTRSCALCGGWGDGDVSVCGRLINADANVWVHVNCLIWSQEVYENSSGALSNVEEALRRASTMTCSLCGRTGASIRCYKLNCDTHFHLPCATQTKGRFMKDKTFICEAHEDVRLEMSLERLDALRRVYVEREENQLIAKLFQNTDSGKLVLRVGTLIFHHIGQLLPEQLKAFHNNDFIFPIGYSVTRIFWSPFNANERMRFECSIRDNKSSAEFVISYDANREIRESSATAAWNRILTAADQTREKAGNMLHLFPSHTSGEALFGLTESAISKMTESLPGVDQLVTYTFKHGGSPLMDLPLAVNPSGCARCEPRFRTLIKHRHHRTPPAAVAPTQRSSSITDVVSRDSRTRGGGNWANNGVDASTRAMLLASGLSPDMVLGPYARWEPGQLSGSYYTQYQKMKKEWKNNVYLARSRIQGLGLYAKRDIEMNAMIIEYKGEVIRSEVGEMREKKYEAQNRGVYMFRIDEERLVDATMAGGPARYINHSCDPNCSTRIVASGPNGDDKKIIIIANRPISAGEELTYDYQFDIEDTADKIACLCGAPNCQKWMN